MDAKAHNIITNISRFLKDYNFLKIILTPIKSHGRRSIAMKLNIRKNCIILTLLTGSSLFGSTQLINQQTITPVMRHQHNKLSINLLRSQYAAFLSSPHNVELAPYCKTLMKLLEAIQELRQTSIFHDIQTVPQTCKGDLLQRFDHRLNNINDFEKFIHISYIQCARMLRRAISAPLQQNLPAVNNELFRVDRHNSDTSIITRYASLALGLNIKPSSRTVYHALANLGKTIGVILAAPHTFPALFARPNNFYKNLYRIQILCVYSIKSLTKIYATGDDQNAFNGRYAPMPFANKESLWFLPSYVPVPAVNFQLSL